MGLSASGTFTASLVSGKKYVVTSISATQNGSSMTLLSPGTYAGNDNYVFSSGAALDSAGLAFASNGVDYNIWFNKGTYCSWSDFNSCTPIAFNLILPAANSLELSVTGPANTNFLAINKVGASTETYFYGDTWITPQPTSYAGYYEFDIGVSVAPYEYMFGTQCVVGGAWDIFDQLHNKWVPTGFPCNFSQGTAHYYQLWAHYVPGDVSCSGYPRQYFDMIGVDYVYYSLASYVECASPIPTGWTDNRWFQFQLDINGSAPANTTMTAFYQYVNFVELAPPIAQAPACGPTNNYDCAFTGTTVVQTPSTPPFNSTTAVNTVEKESILSNAHMSRITDPNTGNNACGTGMNMWNATPSGGSFDVITNTNTTMITQSGACGESWAVGFNPATFQVAPASPLPFYAGTGCAGKSAWSRVDPTIWYCVPGPNQVTPIGTASGTTIYKIRFPYSSTSNFCGKGVGNCPDYTSPQWSVYKDFNTCSLPPVFLPPPAPNWSSPLGLGINDSSLAMSISTTGYQGTARYTYNITSAGCYTFDSQGNGVNPQWYNPSGVVTTIPVSATWFVHDVMSNGPWLDIEQTGCVGCGTASNGPPVWQVGTNNLDMFGTQANAWGHETFSPTKFYTDPNPQYYQYLLDDPASSLQIAQTSCNPCQDSHFAADVTSDANPLLGTTGGNTVSQWMTPYKSEVLGIATDGSQTILRFCSTFSSGGTNTGFQAQFGIGAPSQDRTVFFFASDMLGTLGVIPSGTKAGLNRWDMFACGLVGQ